MKINLELLMEFKVLNMSDGHIDDVADLRCRRLLVEGIVRVLVAHKVISVAVLLVGAQRSCALFIEGRLV